MRLNGFRKSLPALPAAYAAVTSLLCALYVECFQQSITAARAGTGRLSGWFTHASLWRVPLLWLAFTALMWLALVRGHRLLAWLHRHRWAVGAVVVALFTVLRVSGSSVAQWAVTLGDGTPFDGTLWGIPREMRSDEWATFTANSFSQSYTGYAAVSDIIHAAPTNVTLVNPYPAWTLATLFRPFLWGFMLLGSECGLAFYWSARVVALCLVSYEFGRWMTRDDRWLSAAYALLVGFAPMIQWWFAVNAIVEMFVFGQLLVLLFAGYLRVRGWKARWLVALGLAYCAGGYALVMYPAWQIPMCFVFGACGVAAVAQHAAAARSDDEPLADDGASRLRSACVFTLPLLAAALLTGLAMGYVFWQARDAVSLLAHTSYPGARSETGGGGASSLLNYVSAPFSALDGTLALPNQSEQATFYGLFPLGIALSAWTLLRRRRDPLIIALLVVDAVMLTFQTLGLPGWLASVTLLSKVTTTRVKLATTFVDMLLLVRALAVIGERGTRGQRDAGAATGPGVPRRYGLIVAVASPVVAVAVSLGADRLAQVRHDRVLFGMMVVFAALMIAAMLYTVRDGRVGGMCVAVASVFMMVSGLCVNPVQYRAHALTGSPVAAMVRETLGDGVGGAALVTDNPFIGQGMVGNGIPVISAVNSMPALDRWKVLDPDGRYLDVYNRYAYVEIDIEPNGTAAWFASKPDSPDYAIVHVAADALPSIGATHVLTSRDMSAYQSDTVTFTPLDESHGMTLYRIDTRR